MIDPLTVVGGNIEKKFLLNRLQSYLLRKEEIAELAKLGVFNGEFEDIKCPGCGTADVDCLKRLKEKKFDILGTTDFPYEVAPGISISLGEITPIVIKYKCKHCKGKFDVTNPKLTLEYFNKLEKRYNEILIDSSVKPFD